MSTNDQRLRRLFTLLRDTPLAGPSLDEHEIGALLAQGASLDVPGGRFDARGVSRKSVAIMAGAALLLAGGTWLYVAMTSVPDNDKRLAQHHAGRVSAPAAASHSPTAPAAPMKAGVPGITTTTRPAVSAAAAPTAEVRAVPQQAHATRDPGTAVHWKESRPAHAFKNAALVADRNLTVHAPSVPVTTDSLGTSDHLRIAAHRRPVGISGVGMLDLAPDELRKLNIVVDNGRVETTAEEFYVIGDSKQAVAYFEQGFDTTRRSGIIRKHVVIDAFGADASAMPYMPLDTFAKVAPIVVTNSWRNDTHAAGSRLIYFNRSPLIQYAGLSAERLQYALADEVQRQGRETPPTLQDVQSRPLAGMLIPVYVRMGDGPIDGSAMRRGADITLWYYPTPEFVAALPDRYRGPLEKELAAIADGEECHIPANEICRRLTGEQTLLDYCRRSSGALVNIAVHPNPAHGNVTLRYTLSDRRSISIALHDIRGEHLRDFMPPTSTEPGNHSVDLKLDNVPSGIYLVVIRSESGEQAVQRVILQ